MFPPFVRRWSAEGWLPLGRLENWGAQPFLFSWSASQLFSSPPSRHAPSDPGEQDLLGNRAWLLHEWLSSDDPCPISSWPLLRSLAPFFCEAGLPSKGFQRANWPPVTSWDNPGLDFDDERLLPEPSRVSSNKRTWLSTSAAWDIPFPLGCEVWLVYLTHFSFSPTLCSESIVDKSVFHQSREDKPNTDALINLLSDFSRAFPPR